MAEITLLLRKVKRNNEAKLDLSNRELQFIPNEVYSLNRLQVLNLSGNRINYIENKIVELSSLKVLDLSRNGLESVPECLTQINLEALLLDGNPLSPKFTPLLEPSAQSDIRRAIRRCYGLEKEVSESPSWLTEKVQSMESSKSFGRMVEIENQYKKEQQKVQELRKQLDKLAMTQKKSSGGDSAFNLDISSLVLEISWKSLQIDQQISQGGFSIIHKGAYAGLPVAVKKIFNPKINEQLMVEFNNEINMLAKFRHPNIVLLVGICNVPPDLAIITEFIPTGSLYDWIHKRRYNFKPEERTSIAKQCIAAINYMHAHRVAHRDIKSHNFLVTSNLQVKLCDFGLARAEESLNQGPMQFSGTPIYMAQQLYQKKSYGISVDVFALGTLLYELYTSEIPYNGLDPADIKDRLMKDHSLPNKIGMAKPLLAALNDCRHPDPKKRPTTEQLLAMAVW